MKKFLMLLSLLALLMTAGQVHAQVLHGRVVGVSDGDSITVLDAKRDLERVWGAARAVDLVMCSG
jgi:hypothetical protein